MKQAFPIFYETEEAATRKMLFEIMEYKCLKGEQAESGLIQPGTNDTERGVDRFHYEHGWYNMCGLRSNLCQRGEVRQKQSGRRHPLFSKELNVVPGAIGESRPIDKDFKGGITWLISVLKHFVNEEKSEGPIQSNKYRQRMGVH